MNDSILSDICYLDTNIFVYLHDGSAPAKQRVSAQLCEAFSRTGKGRISVQVLSEWRNTMVRKFASVVDKETRRQFLRLLEAWQPLAVTPAIILRDEERSMLIGIGLLLHITDKLGGINLGCGLVPSPAWFKTLRPAAHA